MKDFIPVYEPIYHGNEKKYLSECIETGWTSSEGRFVKLFEEKMKGLVNREFAVAVSSGTAALEIAMKSLNLEDGAEVIVPALTIISCSNAIIKSNAIPVLVDVDPITFNIDVSKIEQRITEKTAAILVPHLYGLPAQIDPLLEIARRYNLKVIEDAAQMHGQSYKNQPCGSFGDISIFSFYANKLVSIGEGGMVLTNDSSLAKKAQSFRDNCFCSQEQRFYHHDIGMSVRMSNLQAAVGVAQLEQLSSFIEKKRSIGRLYQQYLGGIKGIRIPCPKIEEAENIYWAFAVVLQNEQSAADLLVRLREKNIGARPFFGALHKQPIYQKMNLFAGENYPVAEELSQKGFYLPTGLTLNEKKIEFICKNLKEVLL